MDWVAQATRKTRWLGKAWRFFQSIASTQDEAKAWVQQGAPHGAMVIADEQTKGRGRLGRSWFSPPDANIYMTLALQLPKQHPPIGTLSLLVGVAIAEALRQTFSVPAFVKWVNDIIVDGKKLGGILIEGVGEKAVESVKAVGVDKKAIGDWALVGIGLNVNLTEEELLEELRGMATSLRIVTGEGVDRAELLAAALGSLEAWWERWAAGDLAALWQVWERLDWLRGKTVQARLPDGTTLHGIAEGVLDDGALRLRLPDGSVRLLVAGEVTVRKAIGWVG